MKKKSLFVVIALIVALFSVSLFKVPTYAATFTPTGDQAADIVSYALTRDGLKDENSKMCAGFVCTAAKKAGLTSDQINLNATIASPWVGTNQFGFLTSAGNTKYGCKAYTWKDFKNGDYTPKKGDLVFYGYFKDSSAGTASMTIAQVAQKDYYHVHVGIIRDNSSTTSKLNTIDGGQSKSGESGNTWVAKKTRTTTASSGLVSGWTNDGYKVYVLEFIRPNYKDTSKFDLVTFLNYSGKNYMYNSDFSTSLSSKYWDSRDTDVATVSIDSSNKHNGYNSLKIVNTSAGSSGKDLKFRTMTQSKTADNYVGDNKSMILSFYAKASVSGTKIFFRWGQESTDDYRSVSLTTSWQYYTVRMDKVKTVSDVIYPYINKAGTVWMTEVQLEDGTSASAFVPESGGLYQKVTSQYGGNYTLPSAPSRAGYTFDGWYTKASGGTQITSSTAVKKGHITVYAHWTLVAPTITSQPISVASVDGSTAAFKVSASGSGLSYLWQWRSSASGSWTDCTSATQGYNTASLNVSAETARDGYQYRCKVMNSAGTTYSNTATLRVFGVTKQPSSINTVSGRTATFSVAASGNVTGYQWQWRTSAAGSWTNSTSATAGYNTANLTVSAESTRNGYQYRCKVTDVNGNTVYSAPATLKVLGILTQPASVSAAVGETAIFKVVATGDNRTYQWQWRPSASSSWQNCTSATQGYNTASLKVSAETRRNGYQYRCIVTNGSGSITSKTVTLTIESAVSKPVITSHPKNATVGQGSTVVFGVIASGNNLSYKWQWSSDGGKTWKDSTSATAGYNTSSIKVNAETFRNNYRYRCIVSNKAGSVTSNAAVLVVQ